MKSFFKVCNLGLALVLSLAAIPAAVVAEPAPRVAVLELQDNTSGRLFGPRLGAAASDALTTQLVRTEKFRVFERRQIEAILAEQSIGMSGVVDAATAARVGEVLGVELVVLGSITKFSVRDLSAGIGRFRVTGSLAEAESTLDIRVVDTQSAEIIAVAEGSGSRRLGGAQVRDFDFEREFDEGLAQEALRPAVESVVDNLLTQHAQLAAVRPRVEVIQVVGVRDEQIYIDRGENGGLTVGQRLAVIRVEDVIRDAGGNVLDEITERVATLEITRVLSQSSIGRVIEGGAVHEGDRLEL